METTICPSCKAENPAGNQFCQVCGTALASTQAPVDQATVAAARPPVQPVQAPPPPVPSMAAATPVPPPPPVPPVQPAPAVYYGTPLSSLGVRVDGWADVVDNAADRADEIKAAFMKGMDESGVSGVRMAESALRSGKSLPRKYLVVQNLEGATAVVQVAPMGKGLRVGWDLYIHQTPNWITIGVLGGVLFLFALLSSLNSFRFDSFLGGFLNFFYTILNWSLPAFAALLVAGKIFKDDIWAFLVNGPDEFAQEDAESLGMTIDNVLSMAVEEVLEE